MVTEYACDVAYLIIYSLKKTAAKAQCMVEQSPCMQKIGVRIQVMADLRRKKKFHCQRYATSMNFTGPLYVTKQTDIPCESRYDTLKYPAHCL